MKIIHIFLLKKKLIKIKLRKIFKISHLTLDYFLHIPLIMKKQKLIKTYLQIALYLLYLKMTLPLNIQPKYRMDYLEKQNLIKKFQKNFL